MILGFRNCLYISAIFHFFTSVVVLVLVNDSGIKKPFIVFGALSKKNYHTSYKSRHPKKTPRTPVPFLGGSGHDNTHMKAKVSAKSAKPMKGKGLRACSSKSAKNHVHVSKQKTKGMPRSKTLGLSNIKKTKSSSNKSLHTGKHKTPTRSKLLANAQKSRIQTTLSQEHHGANHSKKKLKSTSKHTNQVNRIDESNLKKRCQDKELEKLENEIKEKNKQEETLEKVEKLAQLTAENATKFDDIPTAPESLSKENTDDEPVEKSDANDDISEADIFDLNETSSNIIINFTGELDPEMYSYQRSVQREVERLWKPPLGVSKGTTCRISFSINIKGKVQNFEITKRSSVLIYDLSILRIAHLFKFDKKLWGKNFSIDFCQ